MKKIIKGRDRERYTEKKNKMSEGKTNVDIEIYGNVSE